MHYKHLIKILKDGVNMSKIRLDKNNRPYVIINGGVYRPQWSPYDMMGKERNWGWGLKTQFRLGQEIKVSHISQTSNCWVRDKIETEKKKEMWGWHGGSGNVKDPTQYYLPLDITKLANTPAYKILMWMREEYEDELGTDGEQDLFEILEMFDEYNEATIKQALNVLERAGKIKSSNTYQNTWYVKGASKTIKWEDE